MLLVCILCQVWLPILILNLLWFNIQFLDVLLCLSDVAAVWIEAIVLEWFQGLISFLRTRNLLRLSIIE
jgi:hypothetical protein